MELGDGGQHLRQVQRPPAPLEVLVAAGKLDLHVELVTSQFKLGDHLQDLPAGSKHTHTDMCTNHNYSVHK